MDVSIIIVNYNTLNLLINCLNSIFEKTTKISFEVIIVDNNSSDGSEYVIKEIYNDKVIYVKLLENIGFGRANNEGVKISKGRNLLFLNPDTVLINNAVEILSGYLDENPNVGICGGNLYDLYMKPTHSFQRTIPSLYTELDLLLLNIPSKFIYNKNLYFNYKFKPITVAYITGADLCISSILFNNINGFDPDFFMYFEETELSIRIKGKGYKIICNPEAKIQHLESQSFILKESQVRMYLKGRDLFYNKVHNRMHKKIADVLLVLNYKIRKLYFSIVKNELSRLNCDLVLRNINKF